MKPSTLQLKAAALLQLDQRRRAHHCALSSLHASPLASQEEHEKRGLSMWRRLREIEAKMRLGVEAYTKGERFPVRDTGTTFLFPNSEAWEAFADYIADKVKLVFGGVLPPGFYVETDWREPALKLERKHTLEAFPMDRAGNGILCGKVSI